MPRTRVETGDCSSADTGHCAARFLRARRARQFHRWIAVLFLAGAWASLPLAAAAAVPANVARVTPVSPSPAGHAGFTLMPASVTGIHFTNCLTDAEAAENQIRLNGSGVALGDVDGDGLCDIYLCRLDGSNVLYRNLGNWHFEDITASAGVACAGQYSTGAVFADVDGDGDLDLLVTGIGVGTRLFLNDGHGKFTEAKDSGLVRRFGATTMALADIDGDGLPDLYVANYRTTTIRSTGFAIMMVGNQPRILPEDRGHLELSPEGRVLENGEPDILYRNLGHGHFQPVSWADGTFLDEDGQPLKKPPPDWGLTAIFRDLNGDGRPDLYVCNDFQSPDRVWINDGRGHFRAAPRLALRHTSTFSMSGDFADINRDGFDDFLEADMFSRRHSTRLMQLAGTDPSQWGVGEFMDRPQFSRNMLQLNRGDGTFAEIAYYAGLEASEWTWSLAFLDVDLDGYEDVLCATGQMFDTQDLDAEARIQSKGPWPRAKIPLKLLMYPRIPQRKLAFRNRGNLTFEEMGRAWHFDQAGVAQGMAFADLDNDGDLDVVVNNLNGPAGIYRNDASAPRIAVRLKGLPPNTKGIGAKIRVFGGPVPEQSQEMIAGGRYLSSDEPIRVFAAGSVTNRLRIEVSWPRGGKTVVENARPNSIYEIAENAAAAPSSDSTRHPRDRKRANGGATSRPARRLFEDASRLINHRHADALFDDFARQPLLPRKLSQLGPGVAWADVNGDGRDDLIVGAGRGGAMAVFLGQADGSFRHLTTPLADAPVTRDQTGIVGWPTGGRAVVLAGSSNYEDGQAAGALVRQFDFENPNAADVFPGALSSAGPLALADLYGDEKLELFVGGRCVPGQWPRPADSFLFRNDNGRFQLDSAASAPLAGVGLVSGAVFSDLNQDGKPDLVLACEWGPIRVFMNDGNGRLVEATRRLGLDRFAGFWNGVAVGDFDGDGRPDIVASNWGLNSPYQSAAQAAALLPQLQNPNADLSKMDAPLLYYGDFGGSGLLELIEARRDLESGAIMPIRNFDVMRQGIPSLADRFPTYAAFNRASVAEVLGRSINELQPLRAAWLASTVFLNRGDHFEPVMLPPQAQFAPAFGVTVADFNGDGNADIFLSQNFFEVDPVGSRLDAGRGVVLLGNGRGQFSPMTGAASGIEIYGEGRGAAAADYDRDGRVDLAVAENGAQTKLYHNLGARPGLRVRLNGPAGNPTGIGASIRLLRAGKAGPAQEIHAGSGYWSQDSATLIVPRTLPARISVRWPGGRLIDYDIPAGAREVELGWDGRTVPRR